jgi:hypothetical protein
MFSDSKQEHEGFWAECRKPHPKSVCS